MSERESALRSKERDIMEREEKLNVLRQSLVFFSFHSLSSLTHKHTHTLSLSHTFSIPFYDMFYVNFPTQRSTPNGPSRRKRSHCTFSPAISRFTMRRLCV